MFVAWPSAMGETRYTASDFTLSYDAFVPKDEGLREALTSTGNGYCCVRGSAEWEDASEVHYPGTYAHGVYNRESTVLGAYPVPNEDLVNLPRCWSLNLCLEDEEPLRFGNTSRTWDGLEWEHDGRSPVVWASLSVEPAAAAA